MSKPKHIPHISECLPNGDKLSDKERFIEYIKMIIPECHVNAYSALEVQFVDGTQAYYKEIMHKILNWGPAPKK